MRRSGKYVKQNVSRLKECFRTNIFDIYEENLFGQGKTMKHGAKESKGDGSKMSADQSGVIHNYHMMHDVTILAGALPPNSIVFRKKEDGGVLTSAGMRRGRLMAPNMRGKRSNSPELKSQGSERFTRVE